MGAWFAAGHCHLLASCFLILSTAAFAGISDDVRQALVANNIVRRRS